MSEALRERLIELEQHFFCSDIVTLKGKTDLEIVVNCLEGIKDELKKLENHRHTIS